MFEFGCHLLQHLSPGMIVGTALVVEEGTVVGGGTTTMETEGDTGDQEGGVQIMTEGERMAWLSVQNFNCNQDPNLLMTSLHLNLVVRKCTHDRMLVKGPLRVSLSLYSTHMYIAVGNFMLRHACVCSTHIEEKQYL